MAVSPNPSNKFLSRFPLRDFFFCALLAALFLLPLSPAVQRFPFRDSGVFLYAGWRLGDGEVPYADVWDHKPPLVYFINAAGLVLGGGSVWGVWALEWVSLSAACLLAFRLLKKQFDPWAAGVSLLLMLGVFSILVLGGNFTTEYALPLQLACFTLAAGMREDRTHFLRALGIGALFAGLFLLKQNLIGIPTVIMAFRLASLWKKNRKRSILPEIGGFTLGIGLVIIPILVYFAAHNALAEMWDAAFRFNANYAETGFTSSLKSLIRGLEAVSQAGFGILGLAGWSAGLWLLARNSDIFRKPNAWLFAAALAALPVEFFLAVLPGRYEEHYFLSVLPMLCVFAALALWGLFRGTSFHESSLPVRICGAGLLTAFLFSTSATAVYTRIGSYRTNDWSDVAEYIEAHSSSDDTVLFWGAETRLNFFTHRRSPTKYAYLYPLYRPGYMSDKEVSGFFNDLVANPPLWIVDTKNPMTPFLKIPVDSPAKADFQKWFYENYTKTDEIHGWTFYRWNSPGENQNLSAGLDRRDLWPIGIWYGRDELCFFDEEFKNI